MKTQFRRKDEENIQISLPKTHLGPDTDQYLENPLLLIQKKGQVSTGIQSHEEKVIARKQK